MEYTFKTTAADKVITIVLNQYYLTVKSAVNTESIHYANITDIRLARRSGNLFKMIIHSDSHIPVVISNRYYLPTGECEDLSRQYNTFVRVLHYHLKEKSPANYMSGSSLTNLFFWSLFSAFISFFISFVSEFLGWSLLNSFAQALILTSLIVMTIFAYNRNRLPKTYTPDNIPMQFLPDFWK